MSRSGAGAGIRPAAGEPFAQATLTAPRAPVGWPAWRLRDAMIAGELGVGEVVRAHLDRLEEVEPWLAAAAHVRRDAALAEADALQAGLHRGERPGGLFGVPVTVKDVIATGGTPTECGSRAFAGNVPTHDAVAVARLRAAGAVVIAKSHCPEFAFGVTTPGTRSPWGAHSPGGSSGGEAALVAAGASALGLGTDYGGSLRWPAQCCGVLALRPGLDALDGTGQLPERGGRMDGARGSAPWEDTVQRDFQVVGPIAATVRDLGISLATIGGCDVAAAGPPPADGDSGGLARLRVGWVECEDSAPVCADARRAVRDATAALAGAGLDVEEVPGCLDGLHVAFDDLRDTDPMPDLLAALGPRRALVGVAAGRTLDAAPISHADPNGLRKRILELRAGMLERLERTPVILAPVAPTAACELDGTAPVDGARLAGFELMAQCRAVSCLGMPALSIPVGCDDFGLPLSVQVVGGPGREGLVLRVGLLLEQACGGRRQPPWKAG